MKLRRTRMVLWMAAWPFVFVGLELWVRWLALGIAMREYRDQVSGGEEFKAGWNVIREYHKEEQR